MWIGSWADGWIAYRGDVERQQVIFTYGQIVKSSQFHKEVVRMLPIGDRHSVGRLALLEEQRVATVGHSRRLKAKHCTNCQLPWAERTLRHGHEPICRKELLSAPRARLLRIHYERVSMEHQHPVPLHGHQHWRGDGVWLPAGAGCGVVPDLLNEGLRMHLVHHPRHATYLPVR